MTHRTTHHMTIHHCCIQRTEDDVSLHDLVIWNLHINGIDELLLFLGSNPAEVRVQRSPEFAKIKCVVYFRVNGACTCWRYSFYSSKNRCECEWGDPVLSLINAVCRHFGGNWEGEITAGEEERSRVRVFVHLFILGIVCLCLFVRSRMVEEVLVRERSRKEHAQRIRGTRHSMWGGTFVIKNQKSISGGERVYHKPVASRRGQTTPTQHTHKLHPSSLSRLEGALLRHRETASQDKQASPRCARPA